MQTVERRFLRREMTVSEGKIAGYAAVFNSLSEDLGGFVEMIMPGAFTEAIQRDDVRALVNHDSSLILGRNTAGTLRLFEDEIGLRYEIDPPETSYAADLMESLRRGDIDQSSFGFVPQEESWRSGDIPVRIIHQAQLFDVSPVTFPAYPATSAEARARAEQMSNQPAGAGDDMSRTRAARRRARMVNTLKLIEVS